MPEVIFTEPQLCSYDGDTNKEWFVYFDCRQGDRVLRKQFRGGINRLRSRSERTLMGNALCAYWKKRIASGYNPFSTKTLTVTPSIKDAFHLILSLKEQSCGKRSMQTYKHVTKLFIDWLGSSGGSQIEYLSPETARQYMDLLISSKKYSSRTFNDHLTVLSTLINCMTERNWLAKNPFKGIKKLPIQVGRNIAFSKQEKELLKRHLSEKDRQLFYFTQFIYYCFIRRSELTRLKIENIDWSNRTIVIPSHVSKNKKQESVVIPDSFYPILEQMSLKSLPADYYIFGRKLQPGKQQYVNYNHISTRHNLISKLLGIDDAKGLYSWKHSGVCSLYYALSGDIYSLMRQLRHSDLKTTQIYLKSLGLIDNAAVRSAKW